MSNVDSGPWGEGMEPWSKELEQRLKQSVSNYIKSIQAHLKAEGNGSGQAIANYIGGNLVQSAVSGWLNAKSLPKPEYVHAISRIKGISPGAMWDFFYAEANAIPKAITQEDKTKMPAVQLFELMCQQASPDQLLEFQQVWLNECLKRREKDS